MGVGTYLINNFSRRCILNIITYKTLLSKYNKESKPTLIKY